MSDGHMKVIPQEHLGIRFRSRTEARWAQFFRDQKIPFVYEPDGIGNGRSGYLVDFQLVGAKRPTYFEVKPGAPSPWEYEKLVALAKTMSAHVFVAHGPPSGDCYIEKVFSSGFKERWHFAYEHDATCGYLVQCLYQGGHQLALRTVKAPAGIYAIGPYTELQSAGSFQFDDPIAKRAGRGSIIKKKGQWVR